MGAGDARKPNEQPRRKGITKEVILCLAGLAVVWFSLVGAAAYVVGPVKLCYVTLPGDLCRLAFAAAQL